MGENNNNDDRTSSRSIEEILREKEYLNQIIREEFKKELTILFTDICGYTKYMETMGDIEGRSMLQKHNDIVMPVIEEHNGVVIKTIGDAVMATFKEPLEAVKAAVSIQERLDKHNQKASKKNKIYVKIGVNTGEAIVDNKDIFGDAVNVAARIQAKAGKEVILISENLYEIVSGCDDILCRFHDTVELKGKAEPMALYRVVWKDEVFVLEEKPRVRSHEKEMGKEKPEHLPVFHLEITRMDNHLKISAIEQVSGESSTVRHYEEIPVSIDKISRHCRWIVETLNKANRQGRVSREILMKLREIGQVFSDDLFTHGVKEKLKGTQAEHLVINIDDQLVQIPWELFHDGRHFLCQRFSMGRLVRTRQSVPAIGRARALGRPLKMLILADPKGDLKGAYSEGKQLLNFMDKEKDFINASLRSDGITHDYIRAKIRNFDLVHFAGHSDYDQQNPGESGWRLSSGMLKAMDIQKMAGTDTMPALIFSNACQSARTEEWIITENFHEEIFGLANAFVLSGVKHYVGTFWEILDEPSSRFALEFYKQLISGNTMGEAIRQARLALIKEYGEETIVWGSYLLYGDPTFNYMDQIRVIDAETPEPLSLLQPEAEVRAKEEVIDFAEKETKMKSPVKWVATVVLAIIAAVILWGYPGYLRKGTEKYETAALTYYHEGNFNEALNLCNTLEDKNPELRLIYLIRGNVALRMGNLEAAETAYQRAIKAKKGTDTDKAKALIGLGRIASLRKETDKALAYYQQASEAAPGSRQGYLSQALLLGDKGKYDQALTLLGKASKIAPDDKILAAITNETRKKVALARDQEKQDRINTLVKELLESMKSPPRALPSDGWTSMPLTLWMMDFKTQGYSLQEGEDRLLASGLTERLIEGSRVQPVERAIFNKLLEELKLGTSQLIDRNTALSLGRIMAAGLILSSKIIYSGPQTQVSLRLIETETGRISAVVNESFGSAVPASVLIDKLSEVLINKLEKNYPLQGKISRIEGKDITINIGQRVGVDVGCRFKVVNEDVTLEIVSSKQDVSLVKIIKGENKLIKGLRIEALAKQK